MHSSSTNSGSVALGTKIVGHRGKQGDAPAYTGSVMSRAGEIQLCSKRAWPEMAITH